MIILISNLLGYGAGAVEQAVAHGQAAQPGCAGDPRQGGALGVAGRGWIQMGSSAEEALIELHLAGISVRKNCNLQKVVADDDGGGVTIRTETGDSHLGAALVDCDGLWFTVRAHVVGDGAPVVQGAHGLSRRAAEIRVAAEGVSPPKDDRWYGAISFITRSSAASCSTSSRYFIRPLRGRLGHLRRSGPLHKLLRGEMRTGRTLLQNVNPEKCGCCGDRPPAKNWNKSRITLLGHAAHPMLQYLAQGGNTDPRRSTRRPKSSCAHLSIRAQSVSTRPSTPSLLASNLLLPSNWNREFMCHHELRRSLLLIATYAALCAFWMGFADGVAPNIIAAAYNERSLSVLNWVFQGHRSLPIEHYLESWRVVAAAVQIATILHLVIVLFIRRIDRKQSLLLLKTSRADLYANFILIAFSAAFLALTALSWIHGDYRAYLFEWMTVLAGRNPWLYRPLNAYGPLFNVLAPLVWVNPLANKLLFAFSYLLYVVWLIKDFAPRRGLVALSWPWLVFWLVNPFPWVQIAYFGYFDVLVALACVAAVHSLVGNKDGASGTYLAFGILLKYMPIVILPFLVFSQRRVHFRVLGFCAGVAIFGLVVSVLIWGKLALWPLLFAATRGSQWSIYDVLASNHSPLRLFLDLPNEHSLDWLEKPFLVTAGLGVFAWCVLHRTGPALSAALAVLVTLLFYQVGFINYQMVPFFLISYWVVSDWQQLVERSVLATLLAGYFGLLALLDLVHWFDFTVAGDILYSNIVVFKFLLGCALLVVLTRFSASRR